ncbi:MAG: phosphodiester glycosidase family protein [Clostridia bacterium]|nr:phosphodiester glycosidase family protein [Clostridia bacterium]
MKTIRKTLAILLSVLLLVAALVPSVFAAIDDSQMSLNRIVSQEEYTLIGGVIERDLVLKARTGSHRNEVFVLEVDPFDPNVSIIAGYNDGDADGWGKVPVRTHAEAAERVLGTNVIGAINADFHNQETGEPSGILVMNGVVGHAQNGRPFFAILNDGTPVIRRGGAAIDDVKEAVSGGNILIENGKIVAPKNKLNPRTAIGIKEDKTVVMFVVDGRQDPNSCGMDYPEVAEMMFALGCVDAIELDGGGSSTLLAQHEGSNNLDCRNNPSYGYERKVSNSLLVCTSLQPTGEFDHVQFSSLNYQVAPVSTINISVKGIDTNGYATDLPAGGKLVMQETTLGTFNGTTFTAGSEEGFVTVDYVVDGEVIASTTIEVTQDANNLLESFFQSIVDFFNKIINTFKLLIDKFDEKILSKL